MTTAAVQLVSPHAALIDSLNSANPDSALEAAFVQLQRGADIPLLLAVIKALVTAGVPGLALRLIRSAGAGVRDRADLATLSAQLVRLPSGEIEAAVLHRNCQNARRALIASSPWQESSLKEVDEPPRDVHVFRSRIGSHFVVRDDPNDRLRFVFAMVDEVRHANSLALTDSNHTASFLCLGVPSIAAWNRLLEVKSPLGHVPTIDVIEPDVEALAIWLGMIDSPEPFMGERVALFAGEDAISEYRAFLERHPWRQMATHRLVSPRPNESPPSLDDAFSTSVASAVKTKRDRQRQELEARYQGHDRSWWARRFTEAGRSQPPLRVVGLTTRYSTVMQHALRDIAAAFRRSGCEFELVMQPNHHAVAVDVQQPLLDRQADLIFVINHLRHELADVLPANIPYVCWIQDHMDQLCDAKMGRSVTEFDLVVSPSPLVLRSLYEYPADRMLFSSNLTDCMTYSDDPLDDAELEPYRCDVSYVGHGAGTPESLIEEIASRMGASLGKYLHRFHALAAIELNQRGWLIGTDIVRLMLQAERESGHPALTPQVRRSHIFPQLQRIYDRMLRHQTLAWAANWAQSRKRRFSIYGQGWEQHPPLRAFARGEVVSGRPLRALYQASSVALQVNGYGSLHQRLLDGLASGACMICRYNPLDFVRQPFVTLREAIHAKQLTSLDHLLRCAISDHGLKNAINEAEHIGGTCIEPITSPRRQAHIAMLEAGNPIIDLYTDEGVFDGLADGRFVGESAACDLPGFDQACFKSEAEMHSLLDALVDDREKRRSISHPMKNAVVRQYTFDGLVQRVLGVFSGATKGDRS